MFYHYTIGLSAILDIVSWKYSETLYGYFLKLYLYLYLISQVKSYIYQFWEGEATHQRDVLTP
jgi:hypothetical protein